MSEMIKRILSAMVLVMIAVSALVFSDILYWLFPMALVYTLSILGLLEFYMLSDRGIEGKPIRYLGIFFVTMMSAVFYANLLNSQHSYVLGDLPIILQYLARLGSDGSLLTFTLFMLLVSTLTHQLFFRPIDGSIYSVSTTFAGVFYTSLPVLHVILFLGYTNKYFYIIFFILVTAMTDSGAYFSGKFFGKHNAGLRVSPRKTYEGYIGGTASAIIFGALFNYIWTAKFEMPGFSTAEVLIVSLAVSLLSIVGDLVESVFKRDAKKKDSASLIPGHGGALDLADAMFLTLPAGYYYIYFKQMLGFAV